MCSWLHEYINNPEFPDFCLWHKCRKHTGLTRLELISDVGNDIGVVTLKNLLALDFRKCCQEQPYVSALPYILSHYQSFNKIQAPINEQVLHKIKV